MLDAGRPDEDIKEEEGEDAYPGEAVARLRHYVFPSWNRPMYRRRLLIVDRVSGLALAHDSRIPLGTILHQLDVGRLPDETAAGIT